MRPARFIALAALLVLLPGGPVSAAVQELQETRFDGLIRTRAGGVIAVAPRPADNQDQDWNEFVLVVKGSAGLKIEGEDDIVALNAGDYLNICSHVRHRVEWTDSSCETSWLTVHY